MKRLGQIVLSLGLLLLVFLVLSPMPEAQAETEIASVSATITAPAAGASPDYNPGLPSGAHYYSQNYTSDNFKNDVVWYDVSASSTQLNPNSAVFEAGHVYGVGIRLTAENGYTFTSDTTATINGAAPTKQILNDGRVILLDYIFPVTTTTGVISSVSVTIEAPEAGYGPDYGPVLPSGAHYYSDDYNTTIYSNDVTWNDLTSGEFLPVATGTFEAGHQYRVILYLTAEDGYEFTSSTTATVNGASASASPFNSNQLEVKYTFPALPLPKPVITTQPASVSVAEGQTATFTVAATGAETYQWYYQKPGESTWNKVTVNGTFATYSLTTAARHNGYTYRCKVTNAGGSVTSGTATLTVVSKPTITTQPKSASVAEGKTATFKVVASGTGLSYQWYYQKPGESTWNQVSSNGTSAIYSLVTAARHNGYTYRCKVTNAAGSVYSSTVTLTVAAAVKITAQPKSVTVAKAGDTARTTVTATGDGLTYQWYVKDPGSSSFTKSSNTTKSYSVVLTAAKSGRQVYCVVGDKYGNTVKSSTATLSIAK